MSNTVTAIGSGIADRIRLISLRTFVGLLVLSALLAVYYVLVGNFGEFEGKVLATNGIIILASLCFLCASVYVRKHGNRAVSAFGMSLALVAAVLGIGGLWMEHFNDSYWKWVLVVSVWAAIFAHCFVLQSVQLPFRLRHLLTLMWTNDLLFAAHTSLIVLFEYEKKTSLKILVIQGILAGLLTLLIPLLGLYHWRRSPADGSPTDLQLHKLRDDIYVDRAGGRYRVEALPADNKQPGQA